MPEGSAGAKPVATLEPLWNIWRRWSTRRYERSALRFRSFSLHAFAIQEASLSVARWRPVSARYPARMAHALAIWAACLYTRGRTAEAARVIDECLAFSGQSHGAPAATDLENVASVLAELGRSKEALALLERVIEELRSERTGKLASLLVEHARQLLCLNRWKDALAVLRDATIYRRPYGAAGTRARYLMFAALGETGQYDELERHAEQNLSYFRLLARFSLADQRRYVVLLGALARFWSAAGREQRSHDAQDLFKARRRAFERRLARRRALQRPAFAILERISRGSPPQADHSARDSDSDPIEEQATRLEAAVAMEVAEVHRCQQRVGDTRALVIALAELAKARWRTGGQRSAALNTQREVLKVTRRLVIEDPMEGEPLLAEHLLRFAEWAEVIGLRSDAQAARAEAAALGDGQH